MSKFVAGPLPPEADADDRRLAVKCAYCARDARFQCDTEVRRGAAEPGPCNRRLCEIHAHYAGDQVHKCKDHAPKEVA